MTGLLALATLAAVAAPFRCDVSSPTGRPVVGRPSFNYGNPRIAVALPPKATYVAVPDDEPGWAWVQSNGWIRTKVGWWRARGTLRVSGKRLDAPAPPLRADVGPLSSAPGGTFVPSLLFFPSVGCWKLTATAGGGRLVAVVRVVER